MSVGRPERPLRHVGRVARFGVNTELLVFLVAASVPPLLFADSYLMSIFATVAFYSVVVMSLGLLMGHGGLPSFGHNGFFALGAYVMAVLNARLAVPLMAGMMAAIGVNLVLALVIGTVTLRMKTYYFTAATLGFGVIVIQVIGGLPEITGGWSGLTGVDRLSIFGRVLQSDLDFYLVGTALLFVGLVVYRNLVASRFGRSVRALRDDELATEMLGIPVARQRIILFLVSSVFASIAGSFYALFLKVPGPGNFDLPVMIEQVLMLFVGGSQTPWGAIVGAGSLRFLPEFLGPFLDYKTMLQGLVLILIVIFMPRGLVDIVPRICRWFAPGVTLWGPGMWPFGSLHETAVGEARSQALGRRIEAMAPGEVVLQVSGLSKRFGGVFAVTDVSFKVRVGQIKAVIGPNGAGKTTLFNLLTGVIPRERGRVIFRGVDLVVVRPSDVARLGMARTFQTPRLFSDMTVLENVMVGQHIHLTTGLGAAIIRLPANCREETRAAESSMALLDLVRIGDRAGRPAQTLPFGQRRLLEIARALAVQPLLLLLDEPAAGLNEAEKDELGTLLFRLRDAGITVLLVEHDMRLVMSLADEVLVMDHGEKIAEGTPEEVQRNEAVLRAYLGEEGIRVAG